MTMVLDPAAGITFPDATQQAKSATQGVVDGSSAAAGQVGEFLSAERNIAGATLVLLAASSTTITPTGLQLSLTAGDWDVWFVAANSPSAGTNTTFLAAHVDTNASGLFTDNLPNGGGVDFGSVTGGANAGYARNGKRRYSFAVTTNVYLRVRSDHTVSNQSIYGGIYARRVR